MNRQQFRKHLSARLPSAVLSTGDALGTQMARCYIDVNVATEELPLLDKACAEVGLTAVGVGILSYPGRSVRRVRLDVKAGRWS